MITSGCVNSTPSFMDILIYSIYCSFKPMDTIKLATREIRFFGHYPIIWSKTKNYNSNDFYKSLIKPREIQTILVGCNTLKNVSSGV